MTSLPSLTLLGARIAIVLGVSAVLAPASALAELQVGGTPSAVTIDAQNSSVKEILDVLGKTFDVHVQSTANLDKPLTGTYEGSLPRVLTRVLEGYNVIMRTSKDRIELTVLGARGGSATGNVSSASTVASSAPATTVTAVPASNVVNNTGQATAVAQALPMADANAPTPTPSASSSSPLIVLAEGAAPPVPPAPSSDSGANAFPMGNPTTAEPPKPTPSSTPATFQMGPPTTTLPKASSAGSTGMSGPQPAAAGANSDSLTPKQ